MAGGYTLKPLPSKVRYGAQDSIRLNLSFPPRGVPWEPYRITFGERAKRNAIWAANFNGEAASS